MEVFPGKGGEFHIEPDASSGSYFWVAFWGNKREPIEFPDKTIREQEILRMPVQVADWPHNSDWQIDKNFPHILADRYFKQKSEALMFSRRSDLGDSIMTAITVAPLFYNREVQFTDLGRLRVQECERVVALRTELTKCGAKVVEEGDTLTVYPAKLEELHGAEIETYNDHRMAMCFAILGLKVPGIKIKNPACVKKTFPNFFQKLAATAPHGLGAEIWEVKDGQRTRKLSGQDLFAD
jgi:3-phosphoshikimate 1-carboxyvinyltransferase